MQINLINELAPSNSNITTPTWIGPNSLRFGRRILMPLELASSYSSRLNLSLEAMEKSKRELNSIDGSYEAPSSHTVTFWIMTANKTSLLIRWFEVTSDGPKRRPKDKPNFNLLSCFLKNFLSDWKHCKNKFHTERSV